MDSRPIPAFYCCYLLRSTVRHSSLYVGSTPNPARRLAQHNGRSKGGAVRTSRPSLRPWEMTCVVAGFPSAIAALQFEWAWQNGHLTRHIPADQRIVEARVASRVNSKSGRVRRRPTRPSFGLAGHLANLRLLLRAESFRPWPLEVRFFREDVHRAWRAGAERVGPALRDCVEVALDDDSATVGVERLDVGYRSSRQHLQKSVMILNQDRDPACDVCRSSVDRTGSAVVTCPYGRCRSVSHLTCLAGRFIGPSADTDAATAVLPTQGSCPRCKKAVRWIDVVKEASLRERGEKEVAKLLDVRRDKKTNKNRTKNPRTEVLTDDDASDTQTSSSLASAMSGDETLPASQDVLAGSPSADEGFVVLQSSSEADSCDDYL